MEQYKIEYNNLLKRYNNGIEYLLSHKDQRNKWLPELEKIINQLGEYIDKYNISRENILNGFKEK